MGKGFNRDNTKQSIGYRDRAGKKKGGEEKCGEFPKIILKKLIEKLSDKRERKNGKNSEKNRLNAYLPPSFLKNWAFFIEKNQTANRVDEKACAHTDNVGIHAEKPRKN